MKQEKYKAYLPMIIIGIILLILIPVPPLFLDGAITISIMLSVALLFLSFTVKEVLELSSFPSILLFLTFFRLSLNIASTRMIFNWGEAGQIIPTFGKFVASDNPSLGFIIFLLITLVNFIVITKGGGRIAEVAARFTLEAFPGKQLAIDSDLNNHAISFEEAKKLRKKIGAEAEFYGAMDGASKFVRGEAIASLIITFVNIAGAFFLSLYLKEGSLLHFTALVIGDGLATQVPSLLISLAAATMVTRVSEARLDVVMPEQMLSKPKILIFSSVLIFLISLIPGMPKLLMWPLAGLLFAVANHLEKEKAIQCSPISIQVGPHIEKRSLEIKLKSLKKEIYEKSGLTIPEISIIKSNQSLIKIKGHVIGTKTLNIHDLCEELKEGILNHSHRFITKQYVNELLEKLSHINSDLLDDLNEKKINSHQIAKIFQNLLRESLSIHNFPLILEVIAENVLNNIDIDRLSEQVRKEIAKEVIDHQYSNDAIYAITFDSEVEEMVASSFDPAKSRSNIFMRPKTLENIEKKITLYLQKAKKEGIKPIILTQTNNRLHLFRLLEKHRIAIFSYNEIDEKHEVCSFGKITNDILI